MVPSACIVREWQLHADVRSAGFKILPVSEKLPPGHFFSCCPLHEKRLALSIPNPDMITLELLENIMMAEEVSDMSTEQWDCWDVKYQQRQACWALKHSENWEAKTKRAGHWSMNGRLRCANRHGYCASGHNNTSTPKQMFSVWSVWHSVNNCVVAGPYRGGRYEHGAQAVVWTSHQTLIQMLCRLTLNVKSTKST